MPTQQRWSLTQPARPVDEGRAAAVGGRFHKFRRPRKLRRRQPLLKDEFGLTNSQIDLLLSAFFWFYTPPQPVAGWLAQRDGVRYVLPAGLALWALATIITGLVTGFALLLVLRVQVKASPTHAMLSTGTISLQRSQEFDNRLLICRAKAFKTFCYVAGFAAVAQDSVAKCQRGAVVHQHWLEANSP